MNVIFLDFDGVLHPKGTRTMENLPAFESTVLGGPLAAIVISSTWRQAYSIRALRRMFSPHVAARIIDTTPTLLDWNECYRSQEIAAWLAKHRGVRWVALDDDAQAFSARHMDNLILCDPTTGIRQKQLLALGRWLKEKAPVV